VSTWTPTQHGTDKRRLEKHVASGLVWTLIDTWGSQLVALFIYIILARLLNAEDFGLVALASVFVALGQLFVDQGLSDAVVQRPALTRRELDTAFWASVLTGALLTGLGVLLAVPVSIFLGDARLQPILQVLSLVFVIAAFDSIQLGLMRREMDFRGIAVRRLGAVIAGGVVGVSLAFSGFGAWALVGQTLAADVVGVALLWRASPWRPNFSFSRSDFRSLFAFGINGVGSDLLNFVSRNADNLLIGVFLGPVALGFYAVAYRLLDTSQVLLVAAARRLVFPIFSRLQHDAERIRRAYVRLTRSVNALIMPGYIGLALVAHEAIVVIFGQKWADSATAAAILFAIGPVLTLQSFSGAVWSAVGRPDVTLRFRFITTATNVVGFLIAVLLFGNIVAVAAAYTLRGYLLLPLSLYWMRKYGGVPVSQQLWPLRGVIGATALMAVAVIATKAVIPASVHSAVLLAVEVFVGVITFLIALLLLDRALVRELFSFGIQIVPGSRAMARRLGIRVTSRDRLPDIRPELEDDVDFARENDVDLATEHDGSPPLGF
jgi:PST family polysaccharide transporter